MKKLRCKVCGTKFKIKADERYVAKVNRESLVDCFSCPACGCQTAAAPHYPKLDPKYNFV